MSCEFINYKMQQKYPPVMTGVMSSVIISFDVAPMSSYQRKILLKRYGVDIDFLQTANITLKNRKQLFKNFTRVATINYPAVIAMGATGHSANNIKTDPLIDGY